MPFRDGKVIWEGIVISTQVFHESLPIFFNDKMPQIKILVVLRGVSSFYSPVYIAHVLAHFPCVPERNNFYLRENKEMLQTELHRPKASEQKNKTNFRYTTHTHTHTQNNVAKTRRNIPFGNTHFLEYWLGK
jgi:hypothetical protein